MTGKGNSTIIRAAVLETARKNEMKKVNRLLSVIGLFFIFSGSSLRPGVDIFRYYENRFFLLNHPEVSWNDLKDKFGLADYNRLRLKYQASPSGKVTVHIALDLFSFHGLMTTPLGTSSNLTGVLSPGKNFNSSKSGARAQTQLLNIDMALTLIRSGPTATSIYGLDLRGENLIGWWLEVGYFVSPGRKDKKIVLGFDYTFPLKRGLYWLNEFFYDSSGEKDSSNYNYQEFISGERFTLGQKYFFSMLRYGITDFLSAAVSYIGNWGDGSFILNPMFQYEISQDISISSGFYFPLGKKNGEFNRDNLNIFFIWLKVNF